eukprot:5052934-Pyramimonas_sp.AAC.1
MVWRLESMVWRLGAMVWMLGAAFTTTNSNIKATETVLSDFNVAGTTMSDIAYGGYNGIVYDSSSEALFVSALFVKLRVEILPTA